MARDIYIKRGSEGSRHDPYSFTEYHVGIEGKHVVLHTGLLVWLRVDGKMIEGTEEELLARFKELVGGDIHDVEDEFYGEGKYEKKLTLEEWRAGIERNVSAEDFRQLISMGYVMDLHEEEWYDDGDPENGPRMSGHDEYVTFSNAAETIVFQNGKEVDRKSAESGLWFLFYNPEPWKGLKIEKEW